MGEAIITARIGDSVVKAKEKLVTEIFTSNTVWEVPESCDPSKGISVRIFGGGAGGFGDATRYQDAGGGGSGWMNNGILSNLNKGDKIGIVIGAGGNSGRAGATTYFGKYFSANGGSGTSGGAGGGGCGRNTNGGRGYQFGGGGGGSEYGYGGDGGYWGGGGGSITAMHSGNGGYYGGGGGGSSGNGGYYGGGGGYYMSNIGYGGCIREDDWNSQSKVIGYSGLAGNGGRRESNGNDGTDTSTWTNVFNDGNGYFRGKGLKGYGKTTSVGARGGGGGGFGGNGGKGHGGGGGGYGSNGGNYYGGGGGFGGDGGDGINGDFNKGGGGGGGYGKAAKGGNNGGGGGGYYCPGGDFGGGGGGYGEARYGAGGNSLKDEPGKDGVCIIQYYGKVLEY